MYKNLEHSETRLFAIEDPVKFLRNIPDGAVLDEIQNAPELTSHKQALVDKRKENGLFVLTGSRQFNVVEALTQSLAGRTSIIKLFPFSLEEIGDTYRELDQSRLPPILCGGRFLRIWLLPKF